MAWDDYYRVHREISPIKSSYKSSFLDLSPKTQKERRKKKMIADMLMNKVINMFSSTEDPEEGFMAADNKSDWWRF